MSVQKEIGARLKELRESNGLRQKDLADVLNITPAAYGKLESGERGLNSEYCIILADYYKISCDYILRGLPSEKASLLSETCLSAKAINVLMDQKKAHMEYKLKQAAGTLQKTDVVRLTDAVVSSYVASEILENADLWESLIWASAKTIDQVIEFARRAAARVKNGGSIFDDTPELDNYKLAMAACRYQANQAFARFFEDMTSKPDLVSCLSDYSQDENYHKLAEADLIKAILSIRWR